MKALLETIRNTGAFKRINESQSTGQIYIAGADITEKALIMAGFLSDDDSRIAVITQNELKARSLFEELSNYLDDTVLYLPPKELMLYDVEARSHDNEYERIRVLARIISGDYRAVVIPARALLDILCRPEGLIDNTLMLEAGGSKDPVLLSAFLNESGYRRESVVEGKGQFSQRGGIVDIFPVNLDEPVRLEFFGDDIDSIRIFDPITQRSINNINEVKILPASEIRFGTEQRKHLVSVLKNESTVLRGQLKQKVLHDIEKLKNDVNINGFDRYVGYLSDDRKSILDYLDLKLIFVDDTDKFDDTYAALENETIKEVTDLFEKEHIISGMTEIINRFEQTVSRLDKYRKIYFGNIERAGYGRVVHFGSLLIPSFRGELSVLRENIEKWRERGYEIYAVVSGSERGRRLFELLDGNVDVRIRIGAINNGFELPDEKIAVLAEKSLFNQNERKARGYRGLNTKKISAFGDIRKGDLVVHRVHGIGIYEGINQLVVEGIKKDYIKIVYRDDGALYIPAEQLDAIQKYIGSDDKKPKLNKLGTNEWANTKRKVKESLAKLAGELVKLYAKRQTIKGLAYSEDSPWQKEFEEKFPFEETADQLTSVDEIKKDMENEMPMDRILCGDVGYGKTEVAIRAMFKAVNDSYQVAYLVPTTVLAQQQYNNFLDRFSDYPVKIEMLSRFRTPAQQKQIVKNVKNGSVDILIATHRLLSKDISFKKLGLLVVDEEHRFGVKHKERIKESYPNIDVLTLTATPIPRTLHMSMVGIRDISVIEMPPKERYPVQTYVMEYDEEIIKNAIYREVARGGQVFYIHNRVRDMDLMKDRLSKLVPEIRIEVSHGQMSERELEHIMERFENKETELLLCTTIIESGLDISNANTIIIEDAENFGLAQLYQLKGRVGRSDRHAYAYVTYRKDRILNESAEKRLNAIREFTEFGAGFKIALRDLEIRGAGNLLGPEQHGQMDAVGYDMYCKLLEESIMDAKGEPLKRQEEETRIDIEISAYIDDEYIPDIEQKLEIYKKIAEIESEADILDLSDELTDRFGDIPKETMDLIEISYIKNIASKLGFSEIKQGRKETIFKYSDTSNIDLQIISELGSHFRNRVMFTPSASPYIAVKHPEDGTLEIIKNIKVVLHLIYKLKRVS